VRIIFYALGSLACMLSANITMLLISRALQAIGASVGSVVTQAIIRECFDADERPKFFMAVSVVLSSVPAAGPLLGGYLTTWLGWRANFSALVIMATLMLVYTALCLPPAQVKNNNAAVSLPTLILSMLKNKRILASSSLIALINVVIFGFYAKAPFIFITHFKMAANDFGKLGIFIGASTMLGTVIAHRLSKKIALRRLGLYGVMVAIFAALLLFFVMHSRLMLANHLWIISLAIMVPFGILMIGINSFILPNVLSQALINYNDCLGSAGSILGALYYLLLAALLWGVGLMPNNVLWSLPAFFIGVTVLAAVVFSVIGTCTD
jgi:predicted MFS family arabinose efflux permease